MAGEYVFVATAPILGLVVYCLTHAIVCRCLSGRGPYGPLVGSFLPGLLASILATLLAAGKMQLPWTDVAGYLCLNVVSYGALGWGYFHFVNMNIASLRIRMLYELAEANGRLPKACLLARYGSADTIALRIERLVHGGHLVYRQGRFFSGKGHFLCAARFFDALRRFILGGDGAATTVTLKKKFGAGS
jgi:hypothetical protein